MSEQTCPDCGGQMEKGFVPDSDYMRVKQMKWYSGEPKRSLFAGFRIAGIDVHGKRSIPITAYRCTDCGVLRFYAPIADKK